MTLNEIRLDTNVGEKWLTKFEKSNATESSSYREAIEYCYEIAEDSQLARVVPFGVTAQRREMYSVVVAANKEFTAKKAKKSGKTIVLIQNCIHPGELDGKEASMLFLRKVLITKELIHYLDRFIFVIIPVVNPDGHERLSRYNRPNQNGPKEMGWRTTAHNMNLNRDYIKTDSPEMKSIIRLFDEWLPDFVIDNHTTNGSDYQYQITYGLDIQEGIEEGLATWGKEKFLPAVLGDMEQKGYLVAPYVDPNFGDLLKGINYQPSAPRLSSGYAALQNRHCLLVEAHSLKPYATRVYATLDFNISAIDYLYENGKELRRINHQADSNTVQKYIFKRQQFPLRFATSPEYDTIDFKGYKMFHEDSWILGGPVIRYTTEEETFPVKFYNKCVPNTFVTVPDLYLIPVEFGHIVKLLKLHGIRVDQVPHDTLYYTERYKFRKEEFSVRPYEGRHLVSFEADMYREAVKVPKETYRIATNQRLMRLIVQMLEPKGPDSFVSWGFFDAFFERKEYIEPYIFEPMIHEMIEKEPSLKDEFEAFLERNPKYKTSPLARMDFFYRRSPFFDKTEKVYPIMRVTFKKTDKPGAEEVKEQN